MILMSNRDIRSIQKTIMIEREKGKERKGEERRGKERRGMERKGEERRGKERKEEIVKVA